MPLAWEYVPPVEVPRMPTPGAPTKTPAPKVLKLARLSFWSVAETPMTPRSPAGKVARLAPSLPAAATITISLDHA